MKLDRTSITPISQSDSEVRLQMPQHDNGYVLIRIGSAFAEFLYVPPRLADLPPGFITTVAGVGLFTRDYGSAKQASIGVWGLDFDHAGNLYVADGVHSVVYRITIDGLIERFAGGNSPPDPGDGGLAIDASFVFNRDVAVDQNDNIYIPDVNCRVRRVDRSGVITTVVGTGVCGFSGDGGQATQAQIGEPSYLAADAEDLVFIDATARRIRRLHFATGTISSLPLILDLPGGGDDGGVALDPHGNIYTIDGNQRILRIDRVTEAVTTFFSSGTANVRSLAFDRDGNLYLGSVRITKVSPAGQVLTTWGNGQYGLPVDGIPAVNAGLGHIIGLVIDAAGNIIYSDDAINRVRKINISTGLLETVAGIGPAIIGENGPAIATTVALSPEATELAVLPSGKLVVGDCGASRIRKLANGNLITIAGAGAAIGLLQDAVPATQVSIYPVGLTVNANGSIEVTQRGGIVRVDPNGLLYHEGPSNIDCGYAGDGGPLKDARLCQAWDIARDRDGNLLIADTNNNRVRRVDAKTNVIRTIAGNGGPVSGFERYGNGRSCGDGGPAIDACINTPYGVATDSSGNVYVAEQTGIRKIDPIGTISTFAALPGYAYGGATKIRFDEAGLLYVVFHNRPLRLDRNGVATPLAGRERDAGFAGDGGPARDALLNNGGQATGIAIDPEGNLFFADTANHRIRAVRYGAVLPPPNATISAVASGSTIRATVRDASGRPAPSVRVEFTVPVSGASCVLSSPFAITDATGIATISCTSNCVAGSFNLTAQALTASPTATVSLLNGDAPCRRRSVHH